MSLEVKEKIIRFLHEDSTMRNMAIEENTELLHSGIIDSLKVVELIAYIERTFSIDFDETDMAEENLNSVNNIVRFINKKKSAAT